MGKINKNANLYDKNDKLLRNAPLKDYTIEELEKLIDGMENSRERQNATWILYDLYKKYGNPHEKELIERIKNQTNNRVDEADIERALDELRRELPDGNGVETGDKTEEEDQSKTENDSIESYVNPLDIEDAVIIEENDN